MNRRADYAICLFDEKRYKIVRYDWPRPLKSFPFKGHTYIIDRTKGWLLRGQWRPTIRDWFFSDLLQRDGIRRTLMFFPPPDPDNPKAPILPMDRLHSTKIGTTELTPQIHRAWFVTSLYKDRMRKMRLGGLDLRYLLIGLGVIALILALLYFAGWFD